VPNFQNGALNRTSNIATLFRGKCAAFQNLISQANLRFSQEAIVKGAALRGLLGLQPVKRMSPRHYGYSISMRFREGIDDEDYSWTCPWEGTKWCRHRMEWFIRKVRTMSVLGRITGFAVQARI
jgi:hypothetical protein